VNVSAHYSMSIEATKVYNEAHLIQKTLLNAPDDSQIILAGKKKNKNKNKTLNK